MSKPLDLLTHLVPEMGSAAVYYWIENPDENVEILETRSHPSPRLAGNQFDVCKVRINPWGHVRWCWADRLSEKCVRNSYEKLVKEVAELNEVLQELKAQLNAEDLSMVEMILSDPSTGCAKLRLVRELMRSLCLIPLPNPTVERAIFLLQRLSERADPLRP